MKIQTLKIKNFKLIESEEINLQGHHVWLLGPNKAGKSSVIQAAFGEMPEEPLKEGTSKGEVQIQLSDPDTGIGYTCTFKFSKANQKPSLVIVDETGATQKAPATLFNKLFKVRDFEIDKFLTESSAKQIEAIKNLCGIDWADQDTVYSSKFKERTDKNRDIERVSAKLQGSVYRKDLAPIDITLISQRLNEALEQNAKVDKIKSGIEQREINIQNAEIEIGRLQSLIEAQRDQIALHLNDINKGNDWLKSNEAISIGDIQTEFNQATEHNNAVAENNKVKALKDELEGLCLEVNDIEKTLSDIKEMKANQFKEAQDNGLIPVKGLSIDYEENTLKLDGFPFNSDQINTARKIIAGLEIQAALMEKDAVRIARFDGSLLDSKNTKAVIEWADSKGIQLFIECVSRDSEALTIEVVEE